MVPEGTRRGNTRSRVGCTVYDPRSLLTGQPAQTPLKVLDVEAGEDREESTNSGPSGAETVEGGSPGEPVLFGHVDPRGLGTPPAGSGVSVSYVWVSGSSTRVGSRVKGDPLTLPSELDKLGVKGVDLAPEAPHQF